MRQPNILIVMTDHQRADTVLPEHPAVTPNMDRFVADGVAFTNTHCPSPHCCPARATFMTGLYPTGHGVWNNVCNNQALSRGLKPGVRTWSDDLAEAGYRMAWSGKWHVSVETSPKDHGWEEAFVLADRAHSDDVLWDRYREVAPNPDPTTRGEGECLRPGYGTYRTYWTTDESADAGASYDETTLQAGLDALPRLAAGGEPWALYVGLVAPHDPYRVAQRFLDLYKIEDTPLPPSFEDTLADKPAIYRRMREQVFGQLSEREVREAIRHFWAMCSRIDDQFGRVLEALEATGQAENTLVLFCSDHGDYCGEHGLFCKGIPCFRGAYHVPAVVRWPAGLKAPGRREDAFVSLADFAPTFLELAGVSTDRRFTGASLAPFLRGETPEAWRDEIHTQCNGVELYYTQRSVTTRRHKYTFNGFDRDELYDLTKDPHEMRNVADDPAYAQVKLDLCRRMWRFALQEGDGAISSYVTVALAPHGPAEALR